MINFKGSDEIVSRVAPGGGVVTGVPVVIGSEFLVPQVTAAVGVTFSAVKRGRVLLDADSADTFTQGAPAYWNPSAEEVEDTDTATNYMIGTVEAAAVSDEVIVCLSGGPVPALTGDLEAKANLVDLASVANGEGASLIGFEDAAGDTTETDVEGVLAEIYSLLPEIETKAVTIAAGAATGSAGADTDWIGATLIGCFPASGPSDAIIATVAVDGSGVVTVTTDSNETAETVFTVSAFLA